MTARRIHTGTILILSLLAAALAPAPVAEARNGGRDTRHEQLIDADHYRLRVKDVQTRGEWERRRREIRTTLLLRAGLLPEPERTPLNARVFDERTGDGFVVSKVYFESLPGFLATGNLYRPASGDGPFPAIVTPHGHWKYGRLQNSEQGSIPGRCIDFARMGFVVFSIDMVGYNDSFQFPHDPNKSRAQLRADEPLPYEPRAFRGDFRFPEAELYGFNLGGMQVWNAVRAVDFLESLPYVDRDRIGATGASGGASQTIFLMIADERIKVAAPVNIIGAEKHPGCYCENMPGLWIDLSTIEMAAAFAPKPLLLMSAVEDPWTHGTPRREYPMIRRYYSFYDAGENIHNVHIDAAHNYNAETREAVYEWFCRHLNPRATPVRNPPPVSPEPKKLGDLRVFPDKVLPENALDYREIMRNWKAASERDIAGRFPVNASQLASFADEYRPLLALVLAAERPESSDLEHRTGESRRAGNMTCETVTVGRKGKGDCIELELVTPERVTRGTCVLVQPESHGALVSRPDGTLSPLCGELAGKGYRIVRVRGYASGRLRIPAKTYDSFSWSWTYNRDNTLNGIQDIITALAYAGKTYSGDGITVLGIGSCGIPALMASAVSGSADRVVIDLDRSDPGYDGELAGLLPYGAIRRIGDVRTAALLLMNRPLTLFNAGATFEADWYRDAAGRTGCGGNLEITPYREGVSAADFLR